jgi:hypothetical protein
MAQEPSPLRDATAVLLVLASLALPFLPLPGDGLAQMKVDFRVPGAKKPQLVSTNTSLSVCTAMAAALSYDNPKTGAFTRVSCRD